MAALILPNKRSIWPQQGVALDREKVSETGTIYLSFPGAEFRDLVGNVHLTNPGGQSVAQGGRIATFNGSQQVNKAITLPNGYVNMIVAARIRATATQAGDPGAAFGLYNGTTVQSGIGVGFDPSNNVGLTYLSSNGAGLFQRSPGSLGKWYTVYGQYEGTATNGSAVAYVDGRRVTTGYGGIVSGATDPANEISIGAQHRKSGFLRQFKGDIEWAALMYLPGDSWQTLTDEVAARLYDSGYPYNLLKPAERRIWVPASTGGGGSESQTVAFTLDGISAAVAQVAGRTQSASATLDGVTFAASQVAGHSQTLAASLDGITFSASQSIAGGNSQSIAITLDGIQVSASQTVGHSQSASVALDGVMFASAQTLGHGQSLAAVLDGVSFAATQSAASPNKQQAIAFTLDGIAFDAQQEGQQPDNLTTPPAGLIPKIWPMTVRYEGKRRRKHPEDEEKRLQEVAEEAVLQASEEASKRAMRASLEASMKAAQLELAAATMDRLLKLAVKVHEEKMEEEELEIALLLM